jgi:hypothetical protein
MVVSVGQEAYSRREVGHWDGMRKKVALKAEVPGHLTTTNTTTTLIPSGSARKLLLYDGYFEHNPHIFQFGNYEK